MNIQSQHQQQEADDVFVADVGQWLRSSIDEAENPILRLAAKNLCLEGSGGKRVRPRLVWAFAGCVGSSVCRGSLLDVAVAAELLHSGSLLHDDVIDRGQTRRGRPTANVLWGDTIAVLAGDMMLVQALDRLRELPPTLTASAVTTMSSMIDAVTREVASRGNLDLPLEHWFQIAEGKTGALFGWCGRAVGLLAEDAAAAAAFDHCGQRLGVAFQLADDMADLVGERSGKTRYSDLKNRELSFPILLAAASSKQDHDAIAALWSDDEVSADQAREVGTRLAAGPTLERTAAMLSQELDEALDSLGQLRKSRGGRLIEKWTSMLRAASWWSGDNGKGKR